MAYLKFDIEKRTNLWKIIFDTCEENGVEIYGSFSTKNFHLDLNKWTSYSDVDCVIRQGNFSDEILATKSRVISQLIQKKTNLLLPVHIRNKRLPIDELSDDGEFFISTIDTLIKLLSCPTTIKKEFHEYQLAKFFLRTIYKDMYFKICLLENKSILENSHLKKVVDAKTMGGKLSRETIQWLKNNFERRGLSSEFSLVLSNIDAKTIKNYWDSNKKYLEAYNDIFIAIEKKLVAALSFL